MLEEGYQCLLLVVGGYIDCDGGDGDLGNRSVVQYWTRGLAQCDWSWGYGAEGSEVEVRCRM